MFVQGRCVCELELDLRFLLTREEPEDVFALGLNNYFLSLRTNCAGDGLFGSLADTFLHKSIKTTWSPMRFAPKRVSSSSDKESASCGSMCSSLNRSKSVSKFNCFSMFFIAQNSCFSEHQLQNGVNA